MDVVVSSALRIWVPPPGDRTGGWDCRVMDELGFLSAVDCSSSRDGTGADCALNTLSPLVKKSWPMMLELLYLVNWVC